MIPVAPRAFVGSQERGLNETSVDGTERQRLEPQERTPIAAQARVLDDLDQIFNSNAKAIEPEDLKIHTILIPFIV